MIKKSLRAYITAAELVFFILLHRKAIWFALFQTLEHIVHGVEKILVILLDLHAGDHVHQRIHVAILLGSLKNDVAQQGAVQKRFRLRPERIALLAFALGVGNEGVDKFEDVSLGLDIRQRVIVHGLGKVDAIEHLDLVPPALQESANLSQHAALGIDHHIRGMGLQELGCEPKAGLARAGRADPAEIEVAGVGWIFRAGVHGEPFRGGQQHIVFKLGIDKGLDVLFRSP